MKLFYDKKEPMNCMEALWHSAGAKKGELIPVKFCDGVMYIECNCDSIFVYDKNTDDRNLVATFNAYLSIEFITNMIEHMIYKLSN